MKRNRILLLPFAAITAVLLLPLLDVSVFDGHYTMTVRFLEPERIDLSSVQLATCWRTADADYAIATGSEGETSFQIGDIIGNDRKTIDVPCSGRSNTFGWVSSYHEPPFLIIEYRDIYDSSALVRKQYSIPVGRGDRELVISVQ